MISSILVILVVLGSVLTVLGYLFPRLDRTLPKQLRDFWLNTQFEDWSTIAIGSVNLFVRSTERAASATASISRNVLVSFMLLVAAMFAIHRLNPQTPILGEWLAGSPLENVPPALLRVDLVVATLITLAALIAIRYFHKPLVALARLTQLSGLRYRLTSRRSYHHRAIKRMKIRLEDGEAELGDAERSDIEESISRRENYVESIIEDIERIHEQIRDLGPQSPDKAVGSTFKIFIISLTSLVTYGIVLFLNVRLAVAEPLFHQGPVQGLYAVLSIALPIFVIFLFFQALVPSFMVLLNPAGLENRIAFTLARKEEALQDPLGQSGVFLFMFGITTSLLLTYAAFVIGHLLEPEAYVPQTLQMIVSNAVFDGLTFAATLLVLRSIGRFDRYKITTLFILLFLIVLDLLVAAGFAIGSVYVGTLGTVNAITVPQSFDVLLGLNPDGEGHLFGPVFWVMHTAFLPTLIYLAFVFVMTLAKVIITLALAVSRRAMFGGRGLMSTGAMLGSSALLIELSLSWLRGSLL
jgi:hypothetical protein